MCRKHWVFKGFCTIFTLATISFLAGVAENIGFTKGINRQSARSRSCTANGWLPKVLVFPMVLHWFPPFLSGHHSFLGRGRVRKPMFFQGFLRFSGNRQHSELAMCRIHWVYKGFPHTIFFLAIQMYIAPAT